MSDHYRIFETDEFLRALQSLAPGDARFLQAKLQSHVYPQLRAMPFYGANIRKLRGYDPSTWRYRIGRHRLFFSVDEGEKIVFVLTVEQRRDAYR